MMCFDSRKMSGVSFVSVEDDVERGGRPDLVDSPEVLTWMRTLRNVSRAGGRALCKTFATFADVIVWTVWRFGTALKRRCQEIQGSFQPA